MKKKAGKTLSALFKRITSKDDSDFHNNIMEKSVKIKVFCGIVRFFVELLCHLKRIIY